MRYELPLQTFDVRLSIYRSKVPTNRQYPVKINGSDSGNEPMDSFVSLLTTRIVK